MYHSRQVHVVHHAVSIRQSKLLVVHVCNVLWLDSRSNSDVKQQQEQQVVASMTKMYWSTRIKKYAYSVEDAYIPVLKKYLGILQSLYTVYVQINVVIQYYETIRLNRALPWISRHLQLPSATPPYHSKARRYYSRWLNNTRKG